MLSEAKIIIKEAEDLILGKYRYDIPSFVSKHINDFFFIYAGFHRLFLPIKQFLIIFVPLIFLATLFSNCFSIQKETNDLLVILSFFIPIAIVVFARPSNFCFELISDTIIIELVETIKLNGFSKSFQIDPLRNTINLAKDRVDKRNKNFNWLFAAYLAICTYIFSFYSNLALSISEFNFQDFIDSVTLQVILFLFSTPLIYALITSYKKATDAVFQLIHLSINELEARLNIKEEILLNRKIRNKPQVISRDQPA